MKLGKERFQRKNLMTFLSKVFAATILLASLSFSANANEFYSCQFNGKEASYHQDEVPRMKSLGASCVRLTAATSAVCAVGSVSTIFSLSEAQAVMQSSNRVACSAGGFLVTNQRAVSSQVIVTGPVAVLSRGQATFEHQKTTVVYFRLGSARLSASERAKIDAFARYYGSGFRITITGYTDSTGSAAKNQLLSLQRAGAARDVLIANNVSVNSIVSVSALGEESLRYETADSKALGANRAVEIKAYR